MPRYCQISPAEAKSPPVENQRYHCHVQASKSLPRGTSGPACHYQTTEFWIQGVAPKSLSHSASQSPLLHSWPDTVKMHAHVFLRFPLVHRNQVLQLFQRNSYHPSSRGCTPPLGCCWDLREGRATSEGEAPPCKVSSSGEGSAGRQAGRAPSQWEILRLLQGIWEIWEFFSASTQNLHPKTLSPNSSLSWPRH